MEMEAKGGGEPDVHRGNREPTLALVEEIECHGGRERSIFNPPPLLLECRHLKSAVNFTVFWEGGSGREFR